MNLKTWFVLVIAGVAACAPDPRVATLVDQNDVQSVVHRLFINTDKKGWVAVQACFDDSVLFDMTSLAGGQPARLAARDITAAWDQGLKDVPAVHHQAGNFLITVKDEEAEVFCYGIAMHYLIGQPDPYTRMFVGSYEVHLVRKAGGWKIDRFKFNSKYIMVNKDVSTELQSR
jgi:hypothetical protein